MNKYVATIRVKGTTVRTVVLADSILHARLILEFQFGIGSVLHSPTVAEGATNDCLTLDEVVATIKPIKPLTPQQTRLDSLKRQKEVATKNLKAERERQKVAKAQQQILSVKSQKFGA
jgi:hypothetical protein